MKNVSRAYRLSVHEFKGCVNVCPKVYTCIFCTYLFSPTVCVRHRVCQVGVSCVRLCMCACVCVCSDNCDSCAGSGLAHRQAGGWPIIPLTAATLLWCTQEGELNLFLCYPPVNIRHESKYGYGNNARPCQMSKTRCLRRFDMSVLHAALKIFKSLSASKSLAEQRSLSRFPNFNQMCKLWHRLISMWRFLHMVLARWYWCHLFTLFTFNTGTKPLLRGLLLRCQGTVL